MRQRTYPSPAPEAFVRALIIAPVIIAGLTACASARPVAFQGPAPEGALACALAEATNRDFYPLEGGISDGFIRMARTFDRSAGDVGREVAARLLSGGLIGSNRLTLEHLTMTGAGGMLRLQIVGLDENDDAAKPSDQGLADSQAILTACGQIP